MAGLSIRKSQEAFLKTLELERIGQSKGDLKAMELDEVEDAMLSVAAYIQTQATKYLDEKQAHSSGYLADSITFDEVKLNGGVYSLTIKIAEYFDYVNKGVNGLKKDYGSPYSFRHMGVSKDMLENIRKWVVREGLKVRVSEALKRPIRAERKGKPFSGLKQDEATKAAFAVSKAIKKNGLKPTRFWDRSIKDGQKEMRNVFGGLLLPIIHRELSR